jgi:DNA polymerase-3 subunit delta'
VNDSATLLPTISSRCQKVIFNALDEAMIKDILIQKYKLPLTHAHFISYLAEGSPGRALEFKDLREGLLEKRNHILNAIYFKKFSLFNMEEFSIKDNARMREKVTFLLDILLAWFRDLLVVKTGMDTPLINIDKKEDLFRLNKQYTAEELMNNITVVANTRSLVNANINVKLAFSKMRADLWK